MVALPGGLGTLEELVSILGELSAYRERAHARGCGLPSRGASHATPVELLIPSLFAWVERPARPAVGSIRGRQSLSTEPRPHRLPTRNRREKHWDVPVLLMNFGGYFDALLQYLTRGVEAGHIASHEARHPTARCIRAFAQFICLEKHSVLHLEGRSMRLQLAGGESEEGIAGRGAEAAQGVLLGGGGGGLPVLLLRDPCAKTPRLGL